MGVRKTRPLAAARTHPNGTGLKPATQFALDRESNQKPFGSRADATAPAVRAATGTYGPAGNFARRECGIRVGVTDDKHPTSETAN